MDKGFKIQVYSHLDNIMNAFYGIRCIISEMEYIVPLLKDEVPLEYFDFKEKLIKFLPEVYCMFHFLPKAKQLVAQEKVQIQNDYDEDDIYNRLYFIIMRAAQINAEICEIEEIICIDKASIPDVFFEFKRKFFQFLSGTELFSLNHEDNDPLMDAIGTIIVEEIVNYEAQIRDNSDCLDFTNYCKAFFEDFCHLSSMMKCDTTLQSSTDLSPSKNA